MTKWCATLHYTRFDTERHKIKSITWQCYPRRSACRTCRVARLSKTNTMSSVEWKRMCFICPPTYVCVRRQLLDTKSHTNTNTKYTPLHLDGRYVSLSYNLSTLTFVLPQIGQGRMGACGVVHFISGYRGTQNASKASPTNSFQDDV